MIAVIFEVWPEEGRTQHYLDYAAALRAELDAVDGFISVERFESPSEPGKLLSLSYFRDEEAVKSWRNLPCHRRTQRAGRGGVGVRPDRTAGEQRAGLRRHVALRGAGTVRPLADDHHGDRVGLLVLRDRHGDRSRTDEAQVHDTALITL